MATIKLSGQSFRVVKFVINIGVPEGGARGAKAPPSMYIDHLVGTGSYKLKINHRPH